MKKIIFAVLFLLSISIVSAQLEQNIEILESELVGQQLPGPVATLFSDEKVHIHVDDLVISFVTEGDTITQLGINGATEPSLNVYASEETVLGIMYSDNPVMALQQGLADITEVIYQQYALSTTSNNKVVIDVANVDSLKTYVEVFDFLVELSAVKSVTLLSAKGELRRFELQLLGSAKALFASLKLNKQLKQYIDPLAEMNKEPGVESAPVFYWGSR